MKRNSSRTRGVADIRTMAGRTRDKNSPHQLYLRLACLELEQARRDQEREAALRRIHIIEQRSAEIAAEKAEIAATLGIAEPAGHGGQDTADEAASEFCIKY